MRWVIVLVIALLCVNSFSQSPTPGIADDKALNSAAFRVATVDDFPKSQHPLPIKENEVVVGGRLLKRVEIGSETASVTLFNKHNQAQRPKIELRILNRYGWELDRFTVDVEIVFSGNVRSETHPWRANSQAHRFTYTGIRIPLDFEEPAWILVEGDL